MFSFVQRLFGATESARELESTPTTPVEEEPLGDFALVDASMSGWFNTESGELLQGFPIRPQDTVLDVGCGEG
ncbi:MAG TPA: SAM-dependent methyltransferase, partial [Pseudomonas sp.]|nr:SAM-dependent methyltransferase [Pseudomonas sp.]